ncbi:MAG: p-aminobenzoyl-glutamate transporter AbgT [Rhodothermales bacterium]|jgi:p-aminobenzoyl-glutamate transporter AbgT
MTRRSIFYSRTALRAAGLLGVLLLMAAVPELSHACERCFGAGVDAPAVRAVSASMLVLFCIITGVFGGIVSFFRNMSVRIARLADLDDSSTTD